MEDWLRHSRESRQSHGNRRYRRRELIARTRIQHSGQVPINSCVALLVIVIIISILTDAMFIARVPRQSQIVGAMTGEPCVSRVGTTARTRWPAYN